MQKSAAGRLHTRRNDQAGQEDYSSIEVHCILEGDRKFRRECRVDRGIEGKRLVGRQG